MSKSTTFDEFAEPFFFENTFCLEEASDCDRCITLCPDSYGFCSICNRFVSGDGSPEDSDIPILYHACQNCREYAVERISTTVNAA
jgi:hypothetical protein